MRLLLVSLAVATIGIGLVLYDDLPWEVLLLLGLTGVACFLRACRGPNCDPKSDSWFEWYDWLGVDWNDSSSSVGDSVDSFDGGDSGGDI